MGICIAIKSGKLDGPGTLFIRQGCSGGGKDAFRQESLTLGLGLLPHNFVYVRPFPLVASGGGELGQCLPSAQWEGGVVPDTDRTSGTRTGGGDALLHPDGWQS